MEQSGFIVGIDFGTSKIVGVLGRKNDQGIISILASETIPSDGCVRYGVIYNIREAAGKFKRIVNLLENQVGKKIGKVYVSVAGKSLRAMEHAEIRHMDGSTPISFIDIDKMEQQAKLNKPDFFTNYSMLAPEYYINNKIEKDPIGKTASTLEGRYRLIVGRPNIRTNLQKSITENNQVEIAGYIVGPSAAAALALDDNDRETGCVLIDFGAGTTTLSVYTHNLLRYMAVIPFGGRTITKDIQALGFVYESAEAYKIKYGKIGSERLKARKPDTPDVDLRELNKVIQLRQDEIILNIMNQINESGYADQLHAGAIVIGGASRLSGLKEHLSEKLKMSVKAADPKRVFINNASELMQNTMYTQVLGLMVFANENCEKSYEPKQAATPVIVPPEIDPKEVSPKEPKEDRQAKKKSGFTGLFEKFQNFGGTLFNEEE